MQDNHALSRADAACCAACTCRSAPNAQGKLVRAVRGAIWDVAVDIRRGSPTYGKHVGVGAVGGELAAALDPGGLPARLLHARAGYRGDLQGDRALGPAAERGVIWNDPELAVPWPVAADEAILSDKDEALPRLARVRCGELTCRA